MTSEWSSNSALRKCTAMGAIIVLLLVLSFCVIHIMKDATLQLPNHQVQTSETQRHPKLALVPAQIHLGTANSSEKCTETQDIVSPFLTNKACLNAYLKRYNKLGSGGEGDIPKIRHMTWQSENISTPMLKQIMTWHRLHPEWKFVLWRHSDFEPFVRKYYKDRSLKRLLELKNKNMLFTCDMVRLLILHKYGGVYADLDFTLVKRLDEFLKLPAVVIREPEYHSALVFGMGQWPLRVLLMNSLMMARPNHTFFNFCIDETSRVPVGKDISSFAGPAGMSNMAHQFESGLLKRPASEMASHVVYVPPSYSFHPYKNNNMHALKEETARVRLPPVERHCQNPKRVHNEVLDSWCKDLYNYNYVTNASEPIFGIHDYNKDWTDYFTNSVDIRSVMPNITFATDFI